MTTPSVDIRRRLAAGEPLTTAQVADDYGVSKSLLNTVVCAMDRQGATFTRDRTGGGPGGPIVYTMTTPEPRPTEWGKGRGIAKPENRGGKGVPREGNGSNRKAVAPAPVTRRVVNGKAPHPVPTLGDTVTVFLLALTDDGGVNVGLRDADGATWLTRVDGYSAR